MLQLMNRKRLNEAKAFVDANLWLEARRISEAGGKMQLRMMCTEAFVDEQIGGDPRKKNVKTYCFSSLA